MELIDKNRLKEVFLRNVTGSSVFNELIDMQPIIESYTREEVIAMFKALYLEVQELEDLPVICEGEKLVIKHDVNNLIRQKINALKENEDGNEGKRH